MKIAVVGAGNVGGTLGRKWAEKGHSVVFGVRDPSSEKATKLLEEVGHDVRADTVKAAAQFGDVVVYATPWQVTESAIAQSGNLTNKIVIDCTNPLKADFSGLEIGFNTSGAEQVASWAKGAKVYKSFNQTGWENMAEPAYEGKPSAMLVCGEAGEAKSTVLKLVSDVVFEAVDAGELEVARLVEPFGMTWIHLAMQMGLGRDWAFQIVRRS